jgi:hypothetical protein
MPRSPRLVVCLVLLLLALPSLSAPLAAQQSLPQRFRGTWEGTVGTPSFQSPVTIQLTGGNVGEVVGTIDYAAMPCRGTLALRGVVADGNRVELTEAITSGPCPFEGPTVTLTLQTSGSLAYAWTHPDQSAVSSGTLTRTGGTTGGTTAGTTGGSPGGDWCAQLAATYGPASPSRGPWYGPLEQRVGTITRANADVWVADFVATAVFYNPTTSTTVPWDFGFAFRQSADGQEIQQIIIDSNGTWYYAHYPNGVLASGEALSYRFPPGLANTLDLVVDGDTASFCLNGQFVSTVQLPPAVASDVYLATGLFDTTVVTGRVIDYDGFSVWALPAATAQVVPPSTCPWTGTWDTEFGPLRLTQSGNTVSGAYDWDQGVISGTVSGNVLRGTWNETPSRQPPTDAGEVALTMRDDCQSFTGQWRYGSSEAWRTGWFGQRVST